MRGRVISSFFLISGLVSCSPSSNDKTQPPAAVTGAEKTSETSGEPIPGDEQQAEKGAEGEAKQEGETVAAQPAKKAKNVEAAVVTSSALALSLPSSLSLIPTMNTTSTNLLLAASDFDTFKVHTFNWDPSQEPLKSMNKVLCVFSKTGYNYMANKGPFIAQVTMSDCYDEKGGDAMMQGGESGGGSSQPESPVNVTIVSTKEEGKPLEAKIWYSRELGSDSIEPSMAGTGGDGGNSKQKENIYARVVVAEPVSDENPFGIFRLVWEAYKATDGVEESSRSNAGFIDVYRSETDSDVYFTYNEEKIDTYSYTYDSQTHSSTSTIKNQAIARLNVEEPTVAAALAEGAKTEVVGGTAKTSVAYSWSYSDGNGEGANSSDNSGSYSIGFDQNNILTKYKAAEQNTQIDNYASQLSGEMSSFDPEAAVCRQRSSSWVKIWDYAMFDEAGNKIAHKTGFPILTDKVDDWGYPIMGWLGDWGLHIWGVEDDDTVYIEDNSGNRVAHKFVSFPGKLFDSQYKDITTAQTSNLTLNCTGQCPKATVNKLDYGEWGEGSDWYTSTATYEFNASTKQLTLGGSAITLSGFGDEANVYITINLTDVSSNTYSYQIEESPWSNSGAIRKMNSDGSLGDFVVAPKAITFEPFTYSDANHAYADNGNPAQDGASFNLTHDGWSLQGIDWEEKPGRVTQWGTNDFGPQITLRKGVELTAANTTGSVTAGDKIRIAPAFGEATAKTSSDCSETLKAKVEKTETELSLPEPLKEEDKRIKDLIQAAPTTKKNPEGADEKLPVYFVGGELTKTGEAARQPQFYASLALRKAPMLAQELSRLKPMR